MKLYELGRISTGLADRGGKDRCTMLPAAVVDDLKAHLETVHKFHHEDLAAGIGRVYLPHALARPGDFARRSIWTRPGLAAGPVPSAGQHG